MKIISETSQIATLSYTASVSDSKSKSTDSSTVTADDDDDSHSASPKYNEIQNFSCIRVTEIVAIMIFLRVFCAFLVILQSEEHI